MEAQLQRPSHHHEDAGMHSEHHHHGEKKSVLKKVKEKAKKIKDTIKKHGHSHEHEHEHEGGLHRDEDEDPEVHGAPMHESTVLRSKNLQRGSNTDLDKGENHARVEGDSNALATGNRVPRSENKNTLPINRKSELEDNPPAPNNTPAKIPSSNYGGKEAEVAKMNVHHHAQRPHTWSHDQFVHPVADSAVSPDTTDGSHDTIAEKISSATYAVADKAISAKNVVASKLGYSGGDQDTTSTNKPLSQKVAETLGPVYEKVAGMSKVQGSEGGDNGGGDSSSSVKEYMCEKFRPGDEDKALSEAITDAFQQKKDDVWGTQEEQQQRGKVTFSKEVAERLGTVAENKRESEGRRGRMAAGEESSGEGVTERLKDAVGSWLGKSTGIQTAQDSVGNAFVNNAAGPGGGGGGGGIGPMSSR